MSKQKKNNKKKDIQKNKKTQEIKQEKLNLEEKELKQDNTKLEKEPESEKQEEKKETDNRENTIEKEIIEENKIDTNKEYGKNLRLKSFASFCISAVETNCRYVFLPLLSFISLSSIIKELLSLSKLTFILSLICISFLLFSSFINAFISLLLE